MIVDLKEEKTEEFTPRTIVLTIESADEVSNLLMALGKVHHSHGFYMVLLKIDAEAK